MHSHRLTSMDPGLQRSDATTQAYTFATSAASSKYFHGVDRTFPLPRRGWCAGIRFIPTRNRSGVLLRACQGEWRGNPDAGTVRATRSQERFARPRRTNPGSRTLPARAGDPQSMTPLCGSQSAASHAHAGDHPRFTLPRLLPTLPHLARVLSPTQHPAYGPRIWTASGSPFFFTQAWNRWALPRAHSPPTLAHGAAPRAGNAGNVRHRAPCGGVCGDQTLAEELFWRGARPCGRIRAQRRSTACGKAGDIASWAIASCSHSRPLTRRNAPMSPSLEECSREAISACVMRMARRSPTEKSTATSNQRRPAGDSAEGAIR